MGAEGGEPGFVAWLRRPVATPERFNAGMWRCGKSEFRYLFGVHETFAKGTRSTWTVVEGRLMRFFIQSD